MGLIRRPPAYVGMATRHVLNAEDRNFLNLKFLQRPLLESSYDQAGISESVVVKPTLNLSEVFWED
jgi:hypothetical protein